MKLSVQFLCIIGTVLCLRSTNTAPIVEAEVERTDFSLRRHLADGEEELYVYSKGTWAQQLSLSHPDLYSVSLVMCTDGMNLVKSIYNTDGDLVDCDILENEETIQRFVDDLKANVNDPSKSSAKNDSLTFLDQDGSLLSEDEQKILNIDDQKRQCKKLQRKSSKGNKKSKSRKGSSRSKRSYLIYPGTNWCGKGNNADYATHMGLNTEEDKCCRQHDLCPFAIEGFSSRFNIFNYRLHTLSHCDCDKLFKDCLKNADSGTANVIGKVYFNVVNTQCFDLKLEKTCAKRTWWGTCDKQTTQWVADVKSLGYF